MKAVLEYICFSSLFFTVQSLLIFELTQSSHQYILFTVIGMIIASTSCLAIVKLEQLEKHRNENVHHRAW